MRAKRKKFTVHAVHAADSADLRPPAPSKPSAAALGASEGRWVEFRVGGVEYTGVVIGVTLDRQHHVKGISVAAVPSSSVFEYPAPRTPYSGARFVYPEEVIRIGKRARPEF